jgi:translation elongation factor EF-Tu-like GTPase
MKPEIIVHLRMKEEADGGRHGPFTDGYCPHVRVLGSELWLGVRVSHVAAPVFPGQSATVRLELMYHPNPEYSLLRPGAHFHVLEGPRTVADGEVIDVLPSES